MIKEIKTKGNYDIRLFEIQLKTNGCILNVLTKCTIESNVIVFLAYEPRNTTIDEDNKIIKAIRLKLEKEKSQRYFICPECGFTWRVWHNPKSLTKENSHCRECNTPIVIDYENIKVDRI